MKFFITGANGQLGHNAISDLESRGHIADGSDISSKYANIADGSAVTKAKHRQLDITKASAIEQVLTDVKPDSASHCAARTAVDLAKMPINRKNASN